MEVSTDSNSYVGNDDVDLCGGADDDDDGEFDEELPGEDSNDSMDANNDPLHHHEHQNNSCSSHHHCQNGGHAQHQHPQTNSSCHSLSYAYRTYLRDDIQEQNHWYDVCRSYRQYATFAMAQWANYQYRLSNLPESQKCYLPIALQRETPEFLHRAQLYKEAAIRNQFCLDCILNHAGQPHSQEHIAASDAPNIQHSTDAQMSRVSSVLKSLVRDWSHEGQPEREMSYGPILEMLDRYLPIHKDHHQPQIQTTESLQQQSQCTGAHSESPQPSAIISAESSPTSSYRSSPSSSPPRLCVPGAGVGRLALELVAKGYAVQGNEFSLYMLLASDFILNGGMATPHTPLKLSPWLLESRNLHQATDQCRIVEIPDVDPYSMLLSNSNNDVASENDCELQSSTDAPVATEFSMAAGEFVSIYSNPREHGRWDAVVCCFFLDASPCVVEYIQVIHDMLKEGGYLLNFGPLLWHWSGPAMRPDDKTHGDYQARYTYLDKKYLTSIDLNLQDMKEVLQNVGFDVIEMKTGQRALYTADRRSMMNMDYRCCSLVARKRVVSSTENSSSTQQGGHQPCSSTPPTLPSTEVQPEGTFTAAAAITSSEHPPVLAEQRHVEESDNAYRHPGAEFSLVNHPQPHQSEDVTGYATLQLSEGCNGANLNNTQQDIDVEIDDDEYVEVDANDILDALGPVESQ